MNVSASFPGYPRSPKLRLFCFPFAGGGASLFRSWSDRLPSAITVRPIQLPGREDRFGEPAFTCLQPLVDDVITSILTQAHLPFALFGHSMGSLIAFEVARRLRRLHARQPKCLFVSGRRAPQLPDSEPPLSGLPAADLVRELRRLNGTPAWVLECAELMEFILPTLRADFAVSETYLYRDEPPLDCPIHAFGGAGDPDAGHEDLVAWSRQTAGQFVLRIFPGDHFYFIPEAGQTALFGALQQDMEEILASSAEARRDTV
jgi:medium-chain acyl-[acyl-carrier-protein] hydrolase